MKNWNKIKPKANLIIDAIMFVDLTAVAGLGFLMKYVLLPGYRINEKYGTGTELYYMGLDRHQWGAIHLYLALFLVFLLVLHIIFHWDMIICIFKQMIASRKTRILIALLLGIIGLFLFVVPLFIKPEVAQLKRMHNRNRVPGLYGQQFDSLYVDRHENYILDEDNSSVSQKSELPAATEASVNTTREEPEEVHQHRYDLLNIDGTMTLNEIAARYNISIEELAGVINVPAGYANERLGRLRKRYQFEIDQIRVFVSGKLQNTDK